MGNIDLTGRVAIVTGAGAGLGKNHAVELAKLGAKVVVNDLGGSRDGTGAGQTPADDVVNEIKAAGGEAVANYDNVATVEGGENIVKTAVDTFGKVDILVNNAGILRDKSLAKLDENAWDPVIAVHLKGLYCVTRPAFLNMKANGYGRIISTTSAAGLFGNFGQCNYSAAKLGIVGFNNTMKLEGAKYDIKTNIIAPVAATRLTEDILPPDMLKKMDVKYVTPVVLYLASDQCQDTGMVFNVAAGYLSRSAVMTSPGIVLKDDENTPDKIAEKWNEVTSMDNSVYLKDLNDFLMAMASAQG